MPIFIKDFTWNQTDNLINLFVHLSNCNKKKCDIFTSKKYLKIHHENQICEIVLFDEIDEKNSSCKILDEGIEFHLIKIETKEWPQLEHNFTSKQEKIEYIKQILIDKHEENKEYDKKLNELQESLNKQAIKEAIKLNEQERKTIEKNKNILIANTLSEIHIPSSSQNKRIPAKKIQKNFNKVVDIPPPRLRGEINVCFTERKFPTPKRESTDQYEQKWLQTQNDIRKDAGYCIDDLSQDELDPQWILDKGKSFLKIGNYIGAEAAFSHAISLSSNKTPDLYFNRAEANIQIGNYHKVIEDCSKCLDLLGETINLKLKYKCYSIRAMAFEKLHSYKLAIVELEHAIELNQHDNTELKQQIEKLKIKINA